MIKDSSNRGSGKELESLIGQGGGGGCNLVNRNRNLRGETVTEGNLTSWVSYLLLDNKTNTNIGTVDRVTNRVSSMSYFITT